MARSLKDMTLEELWELFPIELIAPQPEWTAQYREMELELQRLLAPFPGVRITHIGSTAIGDIWSKPIVDILVEFDKEASLNEATELLEQAGFLMMSSEPRRISLNKGYTEQGFADKVFHIHLRYAGDNDEILFRDYLRRHPERARDYEQLKLTLGQKFTHDRDGYTAAKSEFVKAVMVAAKQERVDTE